MRFKDLPGLGVSSILVMIIGSSPALHFICAGRRCEFYFMLNSLILAAASWAALGVCYNSGQDCTAGSRLYVQDSIYDNFLKLLVSKVKSQIIGDGFNENSNGGPVVC